MKPSEIRELPLDELRERIEAERERLFRLRMNHAVSDLQNPMQLKDAKRNIARMLTILTERERALQNAEEVK